MSDQAPVVQAVEAAISTVENPSPSNLLDDVELAISLVKQLKAALAGKHPSLLEIVKLLF